MQFLHRVDDWSGVIEESLVRHEPRKYNHHADVEERTNHESGDDADGQIALGIFTFLCRCGDGIKSNVSKENDRTACQDARPAVWSEGVPIAGMNESHRKGNE